MIGNETLTPKGGVTLEYIMEALNGVTKSLGTKRREMSTLNVNITNLEGLLYSSTSISQTILKVSSRGKDQNTYTTIKPNTLHKCVIQYCNKIRHHNNPIPTKLQEIPLNHKV